MSRGETESSVRNIGTASINIMEETCDDEGSMTDIAKEAVDSAIDTAVFRVQALKANPSNNWKYRQLYSRCVDFESVTQHY